MKGVIIEHQREDKVKGRIVIQTRVRHILYVYMQLKEGEEGKEKREYTYNDASTNPYGDDKLFPIDHEASTIVSRKKSRRSLQ